MELIKIHTGKIRDISVSIIQNSNTIKETKSGFVSVNGSIDHRILSRRNIGSRLGSASSSFSKIEQDLKQLGSFIENAGDIYNQTENTLEKLAKVKFPEGNDWELVKSLTGGISVYHGTKFSLMLDDLKFKFSKENGKIIIKLVGGNPCDYLRYRDLLMQKFEGNTSSWKKGYYKRLITRGIPLYDIENSNFNNSIGYRDTMRRFSNNQFDELSNYIRSIGDSKKKILVKNVKDSVIGTVTDFNVFDYKSVSKVASKGLGALGTGITLYENYKDSKDKGGFNSKKFAINTAVDVGFGAGATAIGAVVGSAILPPIGTVVGAAAGAGINFALNMKFFPGEKSVVDVTKDFANDPVGSTKKISNAAENLANSAVENVGKRLHKIF